MREFRYKNIFIYSSLQSVGHVEDYFVENTEKLAVLVVMPRLKNRFNLFRLYEKGNLKKEKKIISSSNIFLYYFLWYWNQTYYIFKTFSFKERFILFGGHPICFFGMSFINLFRKCEFAYWIGDYFPGDGVIIKAFERVKKFYNDHVSYAFYLSDTINKIMNDRVLNTNTRKTVMWGVEASKIKRKLKDKTLSLLFVGLIKDSQGLEFFYDFLKVNKGYSINILGLCDDNLYKTHQKIIKKYGLEKQVYFPNKFFSDEELVGFSKTCHVGIALYNIDKSNPAYYTDPGKVKTYTELGLPVIMSNTSAIAQYIEKFHAGEVISRRFDSIEIALNKIKKDYKKYLKGVDNFNVYFDYKNYYKEKFSSLEQ